MAAVVANNSLGFAGCPGGVEHVQRVDRRDLNRRDRSRRSHQPVPVQVALRVERAAPLVALHDHAAARRMRARFDRGVEHRLVFDDARRLDGARRRDDHRRAGVVDACRQFAGGEAAEHHGMHRPQPRARQHRDDRLLDHRQVDHHAVALVHAQAAQYASELRGLVAQLRVGLGAVGARSSSTCRGSRAHDTARAACAQDARGSRCWPRTVPDTHPCRPPVLPGTAAHS